MNEGDGLPVEEYNERSPFEQVQSIVQYSNEHAFDTDAVDISQCLSRSRARKDREAYKTYEFLTVNMIDHEDVRNVLSEITTDEYAYTSKKANCPDAYVFGVHMPNILENDPEVYLKFQICDGFIIITIHESERALVYPYRRDNA